MKCLKSEREQVSHNNDIVNDNSVIVYAALIDKVAADYNSQFSQRQGRRVSFANDYGTYKMRAAQDI